MALVLKEREVVELLDMTEAVRGVEESFKLHAQGRVGLAPRVALNLSGEAGAFRVMAASVPDLGSFGLKTLTGIPGSRRPGQTYFVMLLFDGASGALVCVLPAAYLTGVRTGAAAAVAAKYLARQDARSVGVLGAGVQARAQIAALSVVRAVAKIRIFDIDSDRASSMARQLQEQGVEAFVAKSPQETVVGSDVVVAATTSTVPVVLGEWLEAGTHINAIGANSPGKRELDAASFQKAKLVVDFKEQALLEAGDLMQALSSRAISEDWIHAELGDVVAGKKPGRESPGEITIFKSVGVAFQDVAVASWVYQQATARGLGTKIDLEE